MQARENRAGRLIVVGTGIKVVGHVTIETQSYIARAAKLLYLVADPLTESWLQKLNPTAESLQVFYEEGKDRLITYEQMVTKITSTVFSGLDVCLALYGHPGVFVYPSHESIGIVRAAGLEARMLPGISAEDCLFADLGIDPAESGCQSYEATDFLIRSRKLDVTAPVILWQIGAIGELGYRTDRMFNKNGLDVLIEVMIDIYGEDHVVTVYEASQYPVCDPKIEAVALKDLGSAAVTPISTLFVPRLSRNRVDLDMAARLGIRHQSGSAIEGGVLVPQA